MSPVTVIATCAQLYAEALAGLSFAQLVRSGAPVIFGTFSSSHVHAIRCADLWHTGTATGALCRVGTGAAIRRAFSQWRVDCAHQKFPDAQAAYEAANTLQHAMLAGVNFMLHVAGWLEGGLAMGYEKFILDCRPGRCHAGVPRRTGYF